MKQGFSTFFLPFTPCQLPNIKFTSFVYSLALQKKAKCCNFSIIKFTPRIGKINPRLRTPAIKHNELLSIT